MHKSLDELRATAEEFGRGLSASRPTDVARWRELLIALDRRGWLAPDFGTFREAGAVLEGLSGGGAPLGVPLTLTVHYLMTMRVLRTIAPGVLRPVRHGKGLACMAASEPGVGAHPAKLSTTATHEGTGWVLNGTKTFTTGGPLAAISLVLAACGEREGRRELGLFVVPQGTPGLRIEEMDTHPGLETALHATLHLAGVRLPASARIDSGDGWGEVVKRFRHWEDALLQSWVAGYAWKAVCEIRDARVTAAGDEFVLATGRLIAATRALLTIARDSAASLDQELLEDVDPADLSARRYGFYETLARIVTITEETAALVPEKASLFQGLLALNNQLTFARRARERIVRALASPRRG